MKFVLEIEIGYEAMSGWTQLAQALRRAACQVEAHRHEELAPPTQEWIYDRNGNRVGGWSVTR